jgi:hypothetical protein
VTPLKIIRGSRCPSITSVTKSNSSESGPPDPNPAVQPVLLDLQLIACLGLIATQPDSGLPTPKMASVTQDAAADKKKKPSALRSVIAGSTAGAIEIGMLQVNTIMRYSRSAC